MNSALAQACEFAGALYCGIVIGFLYDGIRLLRVAFPQRWAVAAFDALFCVLAGAAFALCLYRLNGGELRLYDIAGAVLGAIWEQFGVSRPFRRMAGTWLRRRSERKG
ncbi:MAG: spore cortex biosynthesis protein YabQ [Clostridia bacterium]|nr:spore cortex biosynthesis protein YabQ [Clostridia bacterium]